MASSDRWLSYAQCGQDRLADHLIRRHYRTLKPIQNARYVDVGAHHPRKRSNTALLYDQGWRGICIEPGDGIGDLWAQDRPEDVYIDGVVSATRGTRTLQLGSSPTKHTLLAGDGVDRGSKEVESYPLTDVLEKHAADWHHIDLLSVDVEGVELEVLESLDFDRWPPTLLIVEVHSSDIESVLGDEIHRFMDSAGYRLAAWTDIDSYYLPVSPRYRADGDGVLTRVG